MHVICPHAVGTLEIETLDGVTIHRFRYAPGTLETLIADGGILANLQRTPWKWLLLPFFLFAMAQKTISLVRRLRPTLIHAHWLIPQGAILWCIGKIFSLPPVVLTSHGGDLFSFTGTLGTWIKRRVLRQACQVAVVSEAMREIAIQLGADIKTTSVCPMGITIPDPPPDHTLPPRIGGQILFVGRLVEKKGLKFLLAAMPAISAAVPHAQLMIIGGGPEEAKLTKQIKDLDMQSRVTLLGPVPHHQLAGYYQQASLFVAPFIEAQSGDIEGLGLVTIEAISHHCPVLVGNVPAVMDVIPPTWRANCVVQANQTDTLAQGVLARLQHPAGIKEKQALYDHVVGTYSWQQVTRRYLQLFNRVTHQW